jgi:hypothetical protein
VKLKEKKPSGPKPEVKIDEKPTKKSPTPRESGSKGEDSSTPAKKLKAADESRESPKSAAKSEPEISLNKPPKKPPFKIKFPWDKSFLG